jgi:hypothetical protein
LYEASIFFFFLFLSSLLFPPPAWETTLSSITPIRIYPGSPHQYSQISTVLLRVCISLFLSS